MGLEDWCLQGSGPTSWEEGQGAEWGDLRTPEGAGPVSPDSGEEQGWSCEPGRGMQLASESGPGWGPPGSQQRLGGDRTVPQCQQEGEGTQQCMYFRSCWLTSHLGSLLASCTLSILLKDKRQSTVHPWLTGAALQVS